VFVVAIVLALVAAAGTRLWSWYLGQQSMEASEAS
jgi:hypothetical protein